MEQNKKKDSVHQFPLYLYVFENSYLGVHEFVNQFLDT